MANFVIPTPFFESKYKRLARKFPSMGIELVNLENDLINNPKLGESLGSNLYKIRLSAKDKGKGKSGGFRIITYLVQEFQNRIYITSLTKGNFHAAIQHQNEIARHHKPTKEERGKFQTRMNSYLGIIKHYKTCKLRKEMLFNNLSCWWWNYVFLKGRIAKFTLRK